LINISGQQNSNNLFLGNPNISDNANCNNFVIVQDFITKSKNISIYKYFSFCIIYNYHIDTLFLGHQHLHSWYAQMSMHLKLDVTTNAVVFFHLVHPFLIYSILGKVFV